MEDIYITISRTQKGVPWDKTLLDSYTIQTEREDAYKAVAQEIMKLDPSPYNNGLYLRAVNDAGDVESYLLVPTEEGFFVRQGNSHWGGWGEAYQDYSEKKKYLVCLDEETNDYKSYTMYQEEDNDRFGVSYGRIGGADIHTSNYNFDKEGAHYYPSKMFWIKYYEKINKGYLDRSEIKDFEFSRNGNTTSSSQAKPQELTDFDPIEEPETRELIEFLISRQREYVQQNYNYNSNGSNLNTEFNQKAIDMAEELLNQMSIISQSLNSSISQSQTEDVQNKIISLYKDLMLTLPRKVNNVSEYIQRIDFNDKESDDYIDKVLENERDLLDNLKDICIADNIIAEVKTTEERKGTVLEKYGLTAQAADYNDKFDVLEKMGDQAYRASKVTQVCNQRTDAAYKACKKELGIHDGGCHLFWHGSRTENWWSIFKNGMSLNPNAIVTGKMFGQGLYFAPLAKKSMGYVDMQGSYWAHGSQRTGYLALFEVAMGKPYEVDHAIDSSFRYKDLKYGCHSVWAKAGRHLYNDECIVYREDQCNIKYLVEVDYDRDREYNLDIHRARNLHLTKIEYTQMDEDNHYISCAIPNFKTCTGLPVKGITVEYNLDNDELTLPSKVSSALNDTDIDFLKEVFKSKFADNEAEFQYICEEIIENSKIPDDIQKRVSDLAKDKTIER